MKSLNYMKYLEYLKITGFLTFSNVLARIFSMIFFIILARSLSVADYGLFRYFMQISMFIALTFTGITTAMTKKLSEKESKKEKVVSTGLYLSFMIFVLSALGGLFFNYWVILFLFAAYIDFFYIALSRGFLNYIKLFGFKLLENIIQLAVLILILGKINFSNAVLIYSFSGLISLLLFEILKRDIKFGKFELDGAKKLIKYAIPVTIGNIAWTFLTGINAIYIKNYIGVENYGIYSVAATICIAFTLFPDALTTILMPKASQIKDKIKRPLIISLFANSLLSMIALLFFAILGKQIITLIFSDKYSSSYYLLVPLALSEIFIANHQLYASALQGLNKPSIPTITISAGAVLNIILSFFLTRNYGLIGASFSLAFSSLVSLSLIAILYSKFHFKNKN